MAPLSSIVRETYPALAKLSPELDAALSRSASRFSVPAGTTLFDVGMRCAGFVLLVQGEVAVSRPSANGREILLYRLNPGDTCVMSLTALLGESEYAARATTRTKSSGYIVPAPLFRRLLDEVPAFRDQQFALLASRLNRVTEALEAAAFSPLEQRLAQALLDYETDTINITHQQLADAVGCVREVASRHCSAWANSGAIETGRGTIRILDRTALQRICEPLGAV